MRYCENCGKSVTAEATFCSECGAAQNRTTLPPTSAAKPSGRTWKIVVAIIGAVGLVVILGVVLLLRWVDANSEAAQSEIPAAAALGDCVAVDGSASTVVSCGQAHKWEIYHTFSWPGTQDHPDSKDLFDVGWLVCEDAFEEFVDHSYFSSDFDYEVIGPNAIDWAEGERTIRCALFDFVDDTLVGTAEGAGR